MKTHLAALAVLTLAAMAAHAQQALGENTDMLTFRKSPKVKTSASGVTTGTLEFEKGIAKRIIQHARQQCEAKKPKHATPFNVNAYRKCVVQQTNLSRTRLKQLTRTRDIF